jgi:putative membrane protein
MAEQNSSIRNDLVHVGRGLLMGSADIVPGVSGGTVALILGIYQRLVTAISHFDATLLGCVRRRQWSAAAEHIDLRFLAALGCGILTGIASLASLMNELLTQDDTRPLTLAAFYGLIVASTVLVARMVHAKDNSARIRVVTMAVIGAAFAYWLTGLTPASTEPNKVYVLLCGMIAICAMILPGISGSFILLLLGLYMYITGIVRRSLKFDVTADDLLTLAIFAAGCVIGLISFSKILRWLLDKFEALTMAILCGFMAGSLRRIWPLKKEVTDPTDEYVSQLRLPPDVIQKTLEAPFDQRLTMLKEAGLSLKDRRFENIWPAESDERLWLIATIVLGAAVLVFVLDWVSQRSSTAGGSAS